MDNTIAIIGIVVVVIIALILLANKYLRAISKEQSKDVLPLDELIEAVKSAFTEILRMDVTSLNLSRSAVLQAQRNKKKLRLAYKNCSLGDLGSKEYINDYIKKMLEDRFNIKETTIDLVIPFNNVNSLTPQDMHDILLHHYKKSCGFDALDEMITENDMIESDPEKGFVITADKINEAYLRCIGHGGIPYADKLAVLAQRIYQRIKGNGVIDEIRDMKIDGVSGGVSGVPVGMFDYDITDWEASEAETVYSYESVYIMYHGMSVHLLYLSFGTQRELERVCKNVYRYENPGQLSKSKPYCINKMADGSRVVVTCPDFSDSWQFFIRKFDTANAKDISTLVTDKNKEVLIKLCEFLLLGEITALITGMQGTGKTTFLKALIKFIRRSYNIGVQEIAFELFLRKTFPYMNVCSFQEGAVSGQEGLDIGKKTDRDVNIIGEIASAEPFAWLVQSAGSGSRFSLGTQHSSTTEILISSAQIALMNNYGYTSEVFARERVIQAIRFDIHLEKDVEGNRYVERVTEIVPGDNIGDYTLVNIIERINGEYHLVNPISKKTQAAMTSHMTVAEQEEFALFMEGVEKVG